MIGAYGIIELMEDIKHPIVAEGPDKGRIRDVELAWEIALATRGYHEEVRARGEAQARRTVFYETGGTIEELYGKLTRRHMIGHRAISDEVELSA